MVKVPEVEAGPVVTVESQKDEEGLLEVRVTGVVGKVWKA